jgi:hypothetical protein
MKEPTWTKSWFIWSAAFVAGILSAIWEIYIK